jgi:hypothetical protein
MPCQALNRVDALRQLYELAGFRSGGKEVLRIA